jgi:hypothetical protein
MSREMCGWSGLGIVVSEGKSNGVPIPDDRVFGARCACGAHVTVVDGRIPFHHLGVNERPPDEPCEPSGEGQAS